MSSYKKDFSEVIKRNNLPYKTKKSINWGTGNIIYQTYIIEDEYGCRIPHSFNGLPAVLVTNSDGVILEMKWYLNGELHRDNDEPAHVRSKYHIWGELNVWYKNGCIHRDNDKPAYIRSYENGF